MNLDCFELSATKPFELLFFLKDQVQFCLTALQPNIKYSFFRDYTDTKCCCRRGLKTFNVNNVYKGIESKNKQLRQNVSFFFQAIRNFDDENMLKQPHGCGFNNEIPFFFSYFLFVRLDKPFNALFVSVMVLSIHLDSVCVED